MTEGLGSAVAMIVVGLVAWHPATRHLICDGDPAEDGADWAERTLPGPWWRGPKGGGS